MQPHNASIPSLVGAALSSPSSQFKRPLASLTFAANYLATGLDPYWMKLTNVIIHLLNGWLVYLLARALLRTGLPNAPAGRMNRHREATGARRSPPPSSPPAGCCYRSTSPACCT